MEDLSSGFWDLTKQVFLLVVLGFHEHADQKSVIVKIKKYEIHSKVHEMHGRCYFDEKIPKEPN